MRKLTAIAVALGFLAAMSLPTLATPATNGYVKTTQEMAAKKKAKKTKKPSAAYCRKHPKAKGCATKKMEKKSELNSTVFSAKTKKPSAAYCKKHPKAKGCVAKKSMKKKTTKKM